MDEIIPFTADRNPETTDLLLHYARVMVQSGNQAERVDAFDVFHAVRPKEPAHGPRGTKRP